MSPLLARYQSTAFGKFIRGLATVITYVVGPAVYSLLLVPRYGYVRSLLGLLPFMAIGQTLEFLLIGPQGQLDEISAFKRNRPRLLRYAIGSGIFTFIGIWAFADTHELSMALGVAFCLSLTVFFLYLWKHSYRQDGSPSSTLAKG